MIDHRYRREFEFENVPVFIAGDTDAAYWHCDVAFRVDEPNPGSHHRGMAVRDEQYEGTIVFTHPMSAEQFCDEGSLPEPVDVGVVDEGETLRLDDVLFTGAPERELDFIACDWERKVEAP